ncbi:MAG: hypothetical protein P4L82_20245 [Ancalomicrobiaceae bacterium]|nr:hypothetical protein [Ancalomicrobiaceae bacterium]
MRWIATTATAIFFVCPAASVAAAEALVYAQQHAGTDATSAGPRLLAIFDADGAFLSLEVRLAPDRASHGLKPALDRGYRLYCGTWSHAGDGPVTVAATLLESYRYPATDAAKVLWQPSRQLAASGKPWGGLTTTLADDKASFAALPQLRLTDKQLQPFRLVCTARH